MNKTAFRSVDECETIVAKFERELRGYHIEKGTIRFPLDEPVPEALIERIAKFRAGEVEAGVGS